MFFFWTPHKSMRGLKVSETFPVSFSGVVLPVPGGVKSGGGGRS